MNQYYGRQKSNQLYYALYQRQSKKAQKKKKRQRNIILSVSVAGTNTAQFSCQGQPGKGGNAQTS